MGILEHFEEWVNFEQKPNLAAEIFEQEVCQNCSCKSETESTPMQITDNMGREIFWEDLGRP